eukprot:c29391_g1_i1 orf=1144-4386(+)
MLDGCFDVILLAETWEQDICRVPDMQGFVKHSIWNKTVGNRGFGGIAIYYKTGLNCSISIAKESHRKFYLWLQIKWGTTCLYVATCYFPPQKSTTYTNGEEEEPFTHLEEDIIFYQKLGKVVLVGDFNARVGAEQATVLQEGSGPECFDLTHKREGLYERSSEDAHGGITHFGEGLVHMASRTGLVICNGMGTWPNSGQYTCHTNKGHSVVDYVLIEAAHLEILQEFWVGDLQPESDHTPIMFSLSLQDLIKYKKTIDDQHKRNRQFTLKLDKKEAFQDSMAKALKNWHPFGSVKRDFDWLKTVLNQVMGECFPSKKHPPKKFGNLPMNKWFDQECKEARRELKKRLGSLEEKECRVKFRSLVRKKKRQFIWQQQNQLSSLLVKDPRSFWKMLKPVKTQTMGNISETRWQTYLQQLYHKGEAPSWCIKRLSKKQEFFTQDKIKLGVRKLAGGKAPDGLGWMAECFKWAGDSILACLQNLFNLVLIEGFPEDWCQNIIVPIYKAGDPDVPSNYRTIMISSLMAKLYSIIVESEIASWTEKRHLRAVSQAGFRPYHSTTDHLLTLRTLIEQGKEVKRTTFCCFVDFEKAFDTVPRHLLWKRLAEIGLPNTLIQAAQELYVQVIGVMKGPTNDLVKVICDIGVKQGCPSSPTLFGIYIDKLEACLQQKGGGGLKLMHLVLFNLLYADDVVLLSCTWRSMQEHLYALQDFCETYKLRVNLKKTQVMIYQPKRTSLPPLVYKNQEIERVEKYKYLGITITDTLNWSFSILQRISAGWNAWYQIENWGRMAETWGWDRKWQLFEAIVVPTILYGCEIWGCSISQETWKKIERIQKKFLGNYMGVKITTPYLLLLEESGRAPLECRALERTVAYIRRVESLPFDRLPVLSIQVSQKLVRLNKGWWKDFQNWLQRKNILWGDIPRRKQECKKYLHMKFMDQDWLEAQGSRARFYKENVRSRLTHQIAPHLVSSLPTRVRQAICRIRLSSHKLQCEIGRWLSPPLPLQDRHCQICRTGAVEDELHFLFTCRKLEEIRYKWIGSRTANFSTIEEAYQHLDPKVLGKLFLEMETLRAKLISTGSQEQWLTP